MDIKRLHTLLLKHHTLGVRYSCYPSVGQWENNIQQGPWQSQFKKNYNADEGLDLYIHIPFCEKLCTFCGLNIKVTKDKSIAMPYIDSLIKEWELFLELIPHAKINNLYIGGGSPNFLSPEELNHLLQAILSNAYNNSPINGIIECDPRYFTAEHFKITQKFSFNRYSVGIQDLSEKVTKNVNRHQTMEQIQAISKLIKSKKENILSFDFIYGLPMQQAHSLSDSLACLTDLAPDMVILYPLAHVPWLKNAQDAYGEFTVPHLEKKYSIYLNAQQSLAAQGYQFIGFEHFVKKDTELYQAFQNKTIKRNIMGFFPTTSRQYLGLGTSAISYSGSGFKQNERIIDKYQWNLHNNKSNFLQGHSLSGQDQKFEKILTLLLSNNQVNLEEAQDCLGEYWNRRFEEILQLEKDQLITISHDALQVTELGRFFLKKICLILDPRSKPENDRTPFAI